MKYLTKLLRHIDAKTSISDTFHRRTNNTSLIGNDDPKKWPASWTKAHFKSYPRFETIYLQKTGTDEIQRLVHSRCSVRKFSRKMTSFQDMSYILYSSCGLIHTDGDFNHARRPYPSAGARYPLELYPLVLNMQGLKRGLYHYNVRDNLLELILEKDLSSWVLKAFGGQDWLLTASVIFIITAVLERTRIKYRDRGYRFALLEAGHMGQNICLFAANRGLGTCALGGYIDAEVDELLDIQLGREVTLYVIAAGSI